MTLSHKGGWGDKSARPTLLKAHQNVADHILPLMIFTIIHIICKGNQQKLLPSLMEKLGAREDTIWEGGNPKLF